MRKNVFTLIELCIVVSIIALVLALFASILTGCAMKGDDENKVREAAGKFISENNIQVKRFSCASDSDGDGYCTCVIVTTEGEKIKLQCPGLRSSWIGATSCKEDFQNVNYTGPGL